MCLLGSVTPRDFFFKESGRQLLVGEVEQVCALFSRCTSSAFDLEMRHSTQSLRGYLDEELTYIHWALEVSHTHPARVLCQGGQCFTADHVIMTVPLGFLKENVAAMFKQALPKIQLVWDAGEDEELYQHSHSEGGAWRDTWYKICGFDTVARNVTVLCG
ncbi:unnamed protein product [Coregonus sp. 'balchen']|nr:unnamed protein product [Coregonus sp. 'balchen']